MFLRGILKKFNAILCAESNADSHNIFNVNFNVLFIESSANFIKKVRFIFDVDSHFNSTQKANYVS